MSRGRKQEVGSFSEPALWASPRHHCLWPASGVGSCDTQADDGNSRPLAWRCCQPWPCPRNACLQVSEPMLVCTWHKSHSGLGPESSFPKQKSDSLPCLKTLGATHPIRHTLLSLLLLLVAGEQSSVPSGHNKVPLCILPALFPLLSGQLQPP